MVIDNCMAFLKKIFFGYQKLFFYINLTKGEYAKVSGLLYETLAIMTLLAVRGINPEIWKVVLIYIFILFVIGGGVGKFLAWIGLAKYNASLSNTHNPEFQILLSKVEKIESNLEKLMEKIK